MEGERKERLYRKKKFRTRVCHRCGEFFLSHAKRGKICSKCAKRPGGYNRDSLFLQIQAIGEQKKINMDKYAIVDSKNEVIMKFRTKNTAKSFKKDLEKHYYEELKIIELKGGES